VEGTAPPFAKWRIAFAYPVKICGRILLFCVGVAWISVKGKRASSKEAPLIIGNHRCFMDPIFIVSQTFASPVSAAENMKLPCFGALTKMFQPILVDRANKNSSHRVAEMIKERAEAAGTWPQTVLFPEGVTTNGKALTYFKVSATMAERGRAHVWSTGAAEHMSGRAHERPST
jgi:1-acyl-sn-glycerol-3-phosphate acyltransferase